MKLMSLDKNHIVETDHIQIVEKDMSKLIKGNIVALKVYRIVDRNHKTGSDDVIISEDFNTLEEAQAALAKYL